MTLLRSVGYVVTIVTVPSANSDCLATRKSVITFSDRQARRYPGSSDPDTYHALNTAVVSDFCGSGPGAIDDPCP